MDYSDGMVNRFNEKAKELNFDNIKAIKDNMNEDEILKNSYDLFISSMTMHHIKDTNMFAQKAYDSLVNGGYVCINDLEKEDGTFHEKHKNDGVEHFGYEKENIRLSTSGKSSRDFGVIILNNKSPSFNLMYL